MYIYIYARSPYSYRTFLPLPPPKKRKDVETSNREALEKLAVSNLGEIAGKFRWFPLCSIIPYMGVSENSGTPKSSIL